MDISGLDKAKVLKALYDHALPLGNGMIDFNPNPLDIEEAQNFINSGKITFENVKGRAIKADLSGDRYNTWLCNLLYGDNAAEIAIERIKIQ